MTCLRVTIIKVILKDGWGIDNGVVTLIVAVHRFLLREGIRELVVSDKKLQLVADTSDPEQIIPLIGKSEPDILLIDSLLPGLDIERVMESIRVKNLRTKVLLFLHVTDEESS